MNWCNVRGRFPLCLWFFSPFISQFLKLHIFLWYCRNTSYGLEITCFWGWCVIEKGTGVWFTPFLGFLLPYTAAVSVCPATLTVQQGMLVVTVLERYIVKMLCWLIQNEYFNGLLFGELESTSKAHFLGCIINRLL